MKNIMFLYFFTPDNKANCTTVSWMRKKMKEKKAKRKSGKRTTDENITYHPLIGKKLTVIG